MKRIAWPCGAEMWQPESRAVPTNIEPDDVQQGLFTTAHSRDPMGQVTSTTRVMGSSSPQVGLGTWLDESPQGESIEILNRG